MTAIARIFLAIAAVLGGSSVAIGAFGRHALQGRLSERALETLEIGTRYQMYHALALLLTVGLLVRMQAPSLALKLAGYGFILGTVLFSGSLYTLTFSGIGILGAIAPLGGAGLLFGWSCLLVSAWGDR